MTVSCTHLAQGTTCQLLQLIPFAVNKTLHLGFLLAMFSFRFFFFVFLTATSHSQQMAPSSVRRNKPKCEPVPIDMLAPPVHKSQRTRIYVCRAYFTVSHSSDLVTNTHKNIKGRSKRATNPMENGQNDISK